MKILTRYILREVISHALIGAAVFTFVIFMRDIGRILELVVRASAPLFTVGEILVYTLPMTLTVTVPMGVLVGILIGLGRMAGDSEVTAMRAAGCGVGLFARVIFIFAVAAWAFAMLNSTVLAPRAAAALAQMQEDLRMTQAALEVQPRVFYEDLPNRVLYVQDSAVSNGVARWQGVFLADMTDPAAPLVTLAAEALALPQDQGSVRLHLRNGAHHESLPRREDLYQVFGFEQSDISVPLPPARELRQARELAPAVRMTTSELWAQRYHADPEQARWYGVEFHRRLALPAACLVLALVGIPLGLSAKKGGKSAGFVLTILLVFVYYLLLLAGVSLGRQGQLPPGVAVWMANAIFLVGGVLLLWRVDRVPLEVGSVRGLFRGLSRGLRRRLLRKARRQRQRGPVDEGDAFERAASRRRVFSARFPQILDDYILRDFGIYLGLILATLLVLTLVFTFFELINDIIRQQVPLRMVGEYMLMVIPSMVYLMMPLTVLLAVLVTLGMMQKANEITAMKATGISIYRIIVPVLVIAAVMSAGLFFFEQTYLPYANRRHEALRNVIKDRPAQTWLRPDRKWIFGQHSTIYYYEFFDPDRNQFASISAFQFDPQTFEITRRVYAVRAHWSSGLDKWIFQQGWTRAFHYPDDGSVTIAEYRTFDVATFDPLSEPPQYFRKEVRQSQEMSYLELRQYIRELQQSGFDVVRLQVQLHRKLSFPVITFVMAVLAVPFALSAGRRGALAGVAVAIGIAVLYWMTAGLFEAMGNVGHLPPALAAWAPSLIFGMAGGYMVLKVPT
jgi:LPS export ABC transporter permease LptG/LPS export ABC transporter permease LptF